MEVEMLSKKSEVSPGVITLSRLKDAETELEIEGITPYIPHRWSEKVRQMMPGHPDKPLIAEKKGVRNPEEEAEACVYRLEDGRPGIPATAIKAAMVGACRFFDSINMVEAKLKFHVIGEGPEQLVPFTGTPILREDTPRIALGSTDLRYRYMFDNWRATVRIKYVASAISQEAILALLDAGGRGGIGDWRPSAPKSHTGTYGRWQVPTKDDES
jgi:hypothetical protein